MKNETIRKLVLSAMFAALCCVATMIVRIPTVAGYTNLGECMCLLAGLVLGPWYGFLPPESAAVWPICWPDMPTMSPVRS
ncbi:MAG: ECF transporter S component [Oscillospiraceae bacterium]